MANWFSNNALELMAQGDIDFENDTIRVLLVDATFDGDDEDVWISDVTTLGELSGTGYSRKTLANVTATQDDTNNRAYVDADDVVWTAIASGETINGALVFKFVTDDTDSPVICFLDVTNQATTGEQVTLQFAAGGIFRINRAAGS